MIKATTFSNAQSIKDTLVEKLDQKNVNHNGVGIKSLDGEFYLKVNFEKETYIPNFLEDSEFENVTVLTEVIGKIKSL